MQRVTTFFERLDKFKMFYPKPHSGENMVEVYTQHITKAALAATVMFYKLYFRSFFIFAKQLKPILLTQKP